MTNRRIMAVAAALLLFATAAVGRAQQNTPAPQQHSQDSPVQASIDTRQTAPSVSPYEFGMFIEHIGNTMYSSLWAEMLDDRKFYFPINSQEPAAPTRTPGNPMRMTLRKWRPIGPDEVIVMDKEKPFVGEQSPRIALDSSTPHGIRQSGIALVKGKKYTGHIWLRGTPGTRIKIALVWGSGAADRQTVSIPLSSAEYKKYPFAFTAGDDSTDASLEITGTGTGNFHIGTLSLMPADNIQGFRVDTIPLLREIKSGFWRYGGNYTSNMIWYHTIGDRDRRPPDWDHAWSAMQTNDLGMDEFMTFCRLIGVEPYISVNAGLGDSHSAAQQVEYINGSINTPMGALRAKNGHPEPYHVRFWNIGNEPWGSWQIGRTDLKYFVIKHNEFAKAMRAVDPSITLIASGLMLEDWYLTGETRAKYAGNLGPLYGGQYDWTGGFLKDCWGNFDGISQHWYAQPGRHLSVEKMKSLPLDAPTDDAYVKVDQTLLQFARYPADIMHGEAEEWQGYQQRFPQMAAKNIFLSIDEYAYFGGGFGRPVTLKQALAYGMIFNEMLRHTDFLTMTAHTMGTSTIDFNRTAATMNVLGLTFKLYADNFVGATPVALTGNSPQPAPRFPPGGDQPKTSSGSPTYPLDMFAALSSDRKFLVLSVINATDSAQNFNLHVAGVRPRGSSTLLQLTGSTIDAGDRVGQPPQVEIKQIPVDNISGTIAAAPISVNVYRIPITQAAQ
jgi:alpha-L-arabinofuranosidase